MLIYSSLMARVIGKCFTYHALCGIVLILYGGHISREKRPLSEKLKAMAASRLNIISLKKLISAPVNCDLKT
jgi:hypothetical protein